MAIANTRLITALREAADGVESGRYSYSWVRMDRCNCGLVARCLTGLSDWKELTNGVPFMGTWSNCDEIICDVSGLPLGDIVRSLASFGFRSGDFRELEYLCNNEIIKRAGFQYSGRSRTLPEKFIAYVRAWADLLEEQLNALDPAIVTDADGGRVPAMEEASHA